MVSLQLSVRGKPSAFDLSPTNEICAVASPGCITFFHLNGLGSPRHVIHFEQPQQIRLLKYQKSFQQCMLSALRGGSISLWDPAKPLRPLVGFIESPNWITDMAWSGHNSNFLATCCDTGDIQLWDSRSPTNSSLDMTCANKSFCSNVEFCPSHPYLLSSLHTNKIHIWDTRYSGRKLDIYGLLQFSDSILQCCWSGQGQEETSGQPSIMVACAGGTLEWWNLSNQDGLNSTSSLSDFSGIDSVRNHVIRPVLPLDSASVMCAVPAGRGAVILRLNKDNAHTSIHLQGRLKDSFSLEKMFTAPREGAALLSRDETSHAAAPALALGTLASDVPILGMRWGQPGRLIPPVHAGLELLVMTEAAIIHAVKISAQSVHQMCGGVASAVVNVSSEAVKSGKRSSSTSNSHLIETQRITSTPSQFPLSGLKLTLDPPKPVRQPADCASPSDSLEPKSALQVDFKSFWNLVREEVLNLEQRIMQGMMLGLSISRVDQLARQITLDIAKQENSNGISFSKLEITDISEFVSLIILFPPDYPVSGQPVFTIKASERSSISLNHGEICGELLAIMNKWQKRHIRQETDNSQPDMFLKNVSKCFCDRVQQGWSDAVTLSTLNISSDLQLQSNVLSAWSTQEQAAGAVGGSGAGGSGEDWGDGDLASHETVIQSQTIIEPLAYKVPCPATSGARFGPRGRLFCFGAIKFLTAPSGGSPDPSEASRKDGSCSGGSHHPKTYADHLVMRRLHREAMFAQEQHKLGREDDSEDVCSVQSSLSSTTLTSNHRTRHNNHLLKSDLAHMSSSSLNSPAAASSPYPTAGEMSRQSSSNTSSSSVHRFTTFEAPLEFDQYVPLTPHTPGHAAAAMSPVNISAYHKALLTSNLHHTGMMSNGETLERLGDSLDLLAQKEAAHMLPAEQWIAADISSDLTAQCQVRVFRIFVDLEQFLAHNYYLGPVTSTSSSSSSDGNGSGGMTSAAACRFNQEQACRIGAAREIQQVAEDNDDVSLCCDLSCQIWSLLGVALDIISMPINSGGLINSTSVSMGSPLLWRLLLHVKHSGDVHTLGAMVAVLGGIDSVVELLSCGPQHQNDSTLQELEKYLERVMGAYANLLEGYCAMIPLTVIRKLKPSKSNSTNVDELESMIVDTIAQCGSCGHNASYKPIGTNPANNRSTLWCKRCNQNPIRCSLCELPVKSAGVYCVACGHGGHLAHVQHWFELSSMCPAGCGCVCAEMNGGDCGLKNKLRGAHNINNNVDKEESDTASNYVSTSSDGYSEADDEEISNDDSDSTDNDDNHDGDDDNNGANVVNNVGDWNSSYRRAKKYNENFGHAAFDDDDDDEYYEAYNHQTDEH